MDKNLDIAARKLYEAIAVAHESESSNTCHEYWDRLPEEAKQHYRSLVLVVQANLPAPIDGEVNVRLPGMHGTQPIKRIFRCDITEAAINAECVELRTWLMELTRNFRES